MSNNRSAQHRRRHLAQARPFEEILVRNPNRSNPRPMRANPNGGHNFLSYLSHGYQFYGAPRIRAPVKLQTVSTHHRKKEPLSN
ncbi:unnamed protein product [Rotaria sp. Silwood2]|nr:unnamed protein product [Rotaria sp. Silwood2]CAF3138467.1 unnamed protein product [Rotaria sp. Silwood2]CAF4194301.1 unnamed protein product [Rotaria sp. Silwood2]CAF4242179.1 unnamed protein product [Rotaria sp. Silwood2]